MDDKNSNNATLFRGLMNCARDNPSLQTIQLAIEETAIGFVQIVYRPFRPAMYAIARRISSIIVDRIFRLADIGFFLSHCHNGRIAVP